MGARVTVARATPTRFFCPPLRPAGIRSSKPASETHARRSATRARTSLRSLQMALVALVALVAVLATATLVLYARLARMRAEQAARPLTRT